ncbi:hypothetical protein ACLB2K_043587 [Fragaria x ananassa]
MPEQKEQREVEENMKLLMLVMGICGRPMPNKEKKRKLSSLFRSASCFCLHWWIGGLVSETMGLFRRVVPELR